MRLESDQPTAHHAMDYFSHMIDRCYDIAEQAKREGRPIVGIMCEFTPRELILAVGGLPICLCGGSAETIPAAEQYLPANLCPLIKSTFGYHVTGRNPFLKWADLVIAETTCDGKKKMFELLSESKPLYILELPQKAGDEDAFEHWVYEVRKLKAHLEQRFSSRITEAKLREAVLVMNRERQLRRALADLMTVDPPPISGRSLLEMKSIISGLPEDFQQYEQTLLHYQNHAPGQSPRNVRVLLTGVPLVHGAERVLELIEACGASVVCMENCTGLKPLLEDVDLEEMDLLRAIARKYYHLPCSVMSHNARRLKDLCSLTAKFRPHCVIELVWQACLTYDVESFHVRTLCRRELNIPYLKITTDYSPADSSRITSRIQAFMEVVRESLGL